MKSLIVICFSPQTLYLANFWFSSYGLNCSWPISLQDFLKSNISRNKSGIKLIFCHVDKHQSFLQVDTIVFGVHRQACLKYPK